MDNFSKDVRKKSLHKRISLRHNLLTHDSSRNNAMQSINPNPFINNSVDNHGQGYVRGIQSGHDLPIVRVLAVNLHKLSTPVQVSVKKAGELSILGTRMRFERIITNVDKPISIKVYNTTISLPIDLPNNQVLPAFNIEYIEDDLDNIDGFVVANGRDICVTVKASLDEESKNKVRTILEKRAIDANQPFVSIWKMGSEYDNE